MPVLPLLVAYPVHRPPALPSFLLRAVCCAQSKNYRIVLYRQSTKEWKFSVVESIMTCEERAVLGEELVESFRHILKQGPFFVPPKTRDVATAE